MAEQVFWQVREQMVRDAASRRNGHGMKLQARDLILLLRQAELPDREQVARAVEELFGHDSHLSARERREYSIAIYNRIVNCRELVREL